MQMMDIDRAKPVKALIPLASSPVSVPGLSKPCGGRVGSFAFRPLSFPGDMAILLEIQMLGESLERSEKKGTGPFRTRDFPGFAVGLRGPVPFFSERSQQDHP